MKEFAYHKCDSHDDSSERDVDALMTPVTLELMWMSTSMLKMKKKKKTICLIQEEANKCTKMKWDVSKERVVPCADDDPGYYGVK